LPEVYALPAGPQKIAKDSSEVSVSAFLVIARQPTQSILQAAIRVLANDIPGISAISVPSTYLSQSSAQSTPGSQSWLRLDTGSTLTALPNNDLLSCLLVRIPANDREKSPAGP
jgi:hypothetical protein